MLHMLSDEVYNLESHEDVSVLFGGQTLGPQWARRLSALETLVGIGSEDI